MKSLLGLKTEQKQWFTENGIRIPVTCITVGPCYVTQITKHTKKTNIQLAFGSKKQLTKAIAGHIKSTGLTITPRFLREVSIDDEPPAVGSTVTVDQVFSSGDQVRVTGTSKGKGFAGVMKRHGFGGMPRTHGTSDRERAPGSIGSTTTPGRVFRGKRMAGRMGSDTVTIRGLTVVKVDNENNQLLVKGLVPGAKNGLVIVTKE